MPTVSCRSRDRRDRHRRRRCRRALEPPAPGSARHAGCGNAQGRVRRPRARPAQPGVTIEPLAVRLTAENAQALIRNYDVVADGSDSFATRHAVGDACLALGKPLVSAAIGSFEGQIATFRGHLPDAPCYRCYVPQHPSRVEGTCADVGVIGALAGIVGSMQALEVVREIVGFGVGLAGRLMIFDALDMRCRTLTLARIRIARRAASEAGRDHPEREPACPRACRPQSGVRSRSAWPDRHRLRPRSVGDGFAARRVLA
nr:HesA/MoeB/ThiF family protein [Hankyongella ginsenosidimutans]